MIPWSLIMDLFLHVLTVDDFISVFYESKFSRIILWKHLCKFFLISNCLLLIIIKVFIAMAKNPTFQSCLILMKNAVVKYFFIFQLTMVTACYKPRTSGLMDEITWEIFNLSSIPSQKTNAFDWVT